MENQSILLKDGFQELPGSIAALLDKTIPAAPTISTPSNVDDAIIAQGVLSKYLLDVFAEMEGFSIAAAMMHIGQLNSVNQAMALASLRLNSKACVIQVILPAAGTIFGLESEFFCEITITGAVETVAGVTVHRQDPVGSESSFSGAMLSAAEAVDLEILPPELAQEGHFYAPQILYDAGAYVYSFSATVNDKQLVSQTVEVSAT